MSKLPVLLISHYVLYEVEIAYGMIPSSVGIYVGYIRRHA